MASHELAGIIGIIAIWTTLGAFFTGYYIAKRKSKKENEKSEEKIIKTDLQDVTKESNFKSISKKFDWI